MSRLNTFEGLLVMLLIAGPGLVPVRAQSTTATDSVTNVAKRVAQLCSAVYGDTTAKCVPVTCDAKYKKALGTWSGPFHSYIQDQSQPGHPVFRPYTGSLDYDRVGCSRNTGNGDIFIVGHSLDRYPASGKLPAKTVKNLVVVGRRTDGTEFSRVLGGDSSLEYHPVFEDEAADLLVWRAKVPAENGKPEMTYTLIDARDLNATSSTHRNVTVTVQVGPDKSPYWQGVVAYGWHQKSN